MSIHPGRLYKLVRDKFVILEPQIEDEDAEEEEDENSELGLTSTCDSTTAKDEHYESLPKDSPTSILPL